MNDLISNLTNQVKKGGIFLSEHQETISQEDIAEFERVCARYVDVYTKQKLYETVLNDNIIEGWNQRKLIESREKVAAMISEIEAIQESRKNNEATIENLSNLVDQGAQNLEIYNNASPDANSRDYNSLVELCKEELATLEATQKAYEWYDAAYAKLSGFSGIEVSDIDRQEFTLLGKYTLQLAGDNVILTNCDVFVGDLTLADMTMGEIFACVIERLLAYEDMQKCASQLGWQLELKKDVPLCIMTPADMSSVAVVALFGDKNHPLVEWGNVPVFDFNNDRGTMESKFRKYGAMV